MKADIVDGPDSLSLAAAHYGSFGSWMMEPGIAFRIQVTCGCQVPPEVRRAKITGSDKTKDEGVFEIRGELETGKRRQVWRPFTARYSTKLNGGIIESDALNCGVEYHPSTLDRFVPYPVPTFNSAD